ncbi:ATP-binding protein [Candidatus Micrarchaeota archaeon]|nr:ATP-binding protein [Candidatus Micrarchaeota archaeon]
MAGVYGIRGTGKTTLLLQIATGKEDSFYVNAEELVFRSISLVDFAESAKRKGFKSLFIDEIHSSPRWAQELKLMYDRGFHEVYFSGSSGVQIQQEAADLSRRALLFNLPPLSFREFLALGFSVDFDAVPLRNLLDFQKRRELAANIAPHAHRFEEYMRIGTLPIYLENKEHAKELHSRIVERIVRRDLAAVVKIDAEYIESAYKLLNVLALSGANEISFNSIAKNVGRNVHFVMSAVNALTQTELLCAVKPYKKGASLIRKEPKILFAPPFRAALASTSGASFETVVGGTREDIFVSNMRQLEPRYVKTERESKTPDYMVGGKTFEIGSHRYKHATDYYVKDGLTLEHNVVPLPLCCMLY